MTVRPERVFSRLGAVLVLAAGLGAGLVAPAYAQGPTDLSVSSGGDVTLKVGGGAKDATFQVRNSGLPAEDVELTIDVPLGNEGVSIIQGTDGCTVAGNSLQCTIDRLGPNDSQSFFVKLQPPRSGGPAAGESRSGRGQARIEYEDDTNSNNNSAGYQVTLNGPDKPKQVAGVTGVVKDEKSKKPVGNAKVAITDSAGKEHTTATSSSGSFSVKSTDDQPIAAGALKIAISKAGYETKSLTKTGSAGDNVRVETMLAPKAGATPSATPDASEPADTGAPTREAAGDQDEGINWLAWLLYALAAALVLGGIGAIVWLFRRRDEDDEDEYGPDGPDAGGPGAPGGPPPGTPGAHGVYHDPYGAPTTVMGGAQPTSVIGGDQPTSMINRAGVDQPTSMIDRSGIDQPTMSHPGPLADDGDDVYPAGRDKYAPGPGYGPDSGYGRSPEPDYGDPDYGYESGGYGQGSGSGGGRHSAGDPDPGYGNQGGYRDQGQGGYGEQPGYDQQDQGGYQPRYGEQPGQQPGHGQQPGYGEQPPRRGGRHSAGDDDRRLDWFED
ncbi:MAG: carboxypeptidase regulatory-like domain-containing protein [Micromonosporaceae bacterium]